ncbi:MAG: hypothetical protein ACM30G_02660, partial [Micromonosporaceae bacterium]
MKIGMSWSPSILIAATWVSMIAFRCPGVPLVKTAARLSRRRSMAAVLGALGAASAIPSSSRRAR